MLWRSGTSRCAALKPLCILCRCCTNRAFAVPKPLQTCPGPLKPCVEPLLCHDVWQTLFFGISADARGQQLLEEYIFNFDFSEGGARKDLTTDGKKFSSSKAAAGQVTTPCPSD